MRFHENWSSPHEVYKGQAADLDVTFEVSNVVISDEMEVAGLSAPLAPMCTNSPTAIEVEHRISKQPGARQIASAAADESEDQGESFLGETCRVKHVKHPVDGNSDLE